MTEPTPEQIRERSAEIRAGWTEQDHKKRAVGQQLPEPYTIPNVSLNTEKTDYR
ncbi:MAG: hypothetical protein KDA52_16260 [Planctomycetaceae bacterium]|nr:hypothetical protein [Planctomycetaceae bacterium]